MLESLNIALTTILFSNVSLSLFSTQNEKCVSSFENTYDNKLFSHVLLGQNWFNYVRQVSNLKSGFKLNNLINNEV
jgi:hypothetical protein